MSLALTKEQAEYRFIPELDNLPLLNAQFKKQCFSRHAHEGYCIGVIEQGAQRFYRSGGNHIASENCIILVNADQIHDGQTATEQGWRYRAIYPLESMFNEVLSQFANQTGSPLFKDPVVSDRDLARQFRTFFSLANTETNSLEIQSIYYQVMSQLVLRHASGIVSPLKAQKDKKAARQICDYIMANLHNSITTEELSQLTGLNPFYLIRVFQKTMGLPPHAWQNQKRLLKATDLLKSGLSATESGIAVGFNDQSHFNRHFVRMWGTTPGRFQKAWMAQN
ncbi:AraC family ligand binding domain-containing protein [Planctobacterium marinum]|uniref:AraC family ligand binding domain-containing protein n=1 Tax=Planctobacterium marinum TaxID=1631968 RepID=UPI001E46D78E|nr:AraC family transcriptional regulator [Planctobacterium marinum]MCC2607467.1 AraC family transcriptional regulator [Planctobacterium marinum]